MAMKLFEIAERITLNRFNTIIPKLLHEDVVNKPPADTATGGELLRTKKEAWYLFKFGCAQ